VSVRNEGISTSYILPRSLSVMVPALNEEANLEATVLELLKALGATVRDYEILIIDDGSTDRTPAIAKALAETSTRIRVFHHPQTVGLGECYRLGIQEATKKYYVFVPGDNGWPYGSLLELFDNLGNAEIVTAYASNPEVRPLARRLISRLYTLVLNVLFGNCMKYYNGLTMYPISFLRRSPFYTNGFGYQAELLLRALQEGLSIVEIPLPIRERISGVSKAVRLRNIASVLWNVIRLYWQLSVRRRARCEPAS